MPLVCPQCQQSYEQQSVCPLCNVILLYHAQTMQPETPALPTLDESIPQWQQTPWGKILIGLILAQGLSHGVRQLLTAGFLAGGDSTDVWETLYGLVLLHAICAISVIIGGAITGAGQPRGIVFGALVGLANGVLTFFLFGRVKEATTSPLVFAEPLIQLVTGALGGALGMLIWQPPPTIPELDGNTPAPVPRMNLGEMFGNLLAGPIHMARVCAGAFVVVLGVVWSGAILEFLLRASNGTFTISSHLQSQLVTMEIAGLVALIGAAFAGATTVNGLKQGLCVGFGASIVVIGVQMNNPKIMLETMVMTLAGIIVLTLVGGWFGSKLFPPVEANKKRRSIYD